MAPFLQNRAQLLPKRAILAQLRGTEMEGAGFDCTALKGAKFDCTEFIHVKRGAKNVFQFLFIIAHGLILFNYLSEYRIFSVK